MEKAHFNLRFLKKYKLYIYINIAGLALSLACILSICSYIYQELMTDHFIKDIDRVYFTVANTNNNPKPVHTQLVENLSSYQMLDHPAVELYSEFITPNKDFLYFKDETYKANVFIADENFLKIVTYPVVGQLKENLLSEATEGVITKKFAKKIFGEESPLGKKVLHSSGKYVTITAVLEDNLKSSFPFDILIQKKLLEKWDQRAHGIVRLFSKQDFKKINKLYNYYEKEREGGSSTIRYQLYPVKKFYLDPYIVSYTKTIQKGNRGYLISLGIISYIIFITGVSNFINAYTAFLIKRKNEFLLKKVLGAKNIQIYQLIFLEIFFIVLFSLFLSWTMVELFSGWLWKNLRIIHIQNIGFSLYLSGIILIVIPLISSIYPFLRQRSLSDPSFIKRKKHGQRFQGRRFFLLSQYTITFILIIFSCMFVRQLSFMLNQKMGFDTENILITHFIYSPVHLTTESIKKHRENMKFLEKELTENTLFVDVTYGTPIVSMKKDIHPMRIPGETYQLVNGWVNTRNTLNFFGLELVKGRNWGEDEEENYHSLLINETAAALFNFKNPDSAYLEVERPLAYRSSETYGETCIYKVIGIVKDFHIDHLSQKIPPMIFYYFSGGAWADTMIKLDPEKKEESLEYLTKLNREVDNGEFEYSMLSDVIDKLYEKDRQLAMICFLFALVAIIISLLGIFSVSLLEIRQRLREIAIRKVNGAQPEEIFQLLMKKYMQILIVAFVFASVISFVVLHYYLKDFENKTSLSGWIFLLAFLITASTTWITLSWQIRKASLTNPTKIINSK